MCVCVCVCVCVCGQKRRWNEVVKDDLKKCDLLADWRDVASQREAWRGVVKMAANELNQQLELSEKEKKDQLKKRREAGVQSASYAVSCNEPGCSFTSISNAGLTNHKRQKHGPAALPPVLSTARIQHARETLSW